MTLKARLAMAWLLLCSAVWAAPGLEIDAALEVATQPLPFGKPATLVVNLSWEKSWPFTPPPAESLSLEGFTIIDSFQTEAPPALDPGRKGTTYRIVFTRFEPGPAKLAPLRFETPTGTVSGPSLSLEYKGAEPLEDDLPDQLRAAKPATELSTRDWWKAVAQGTLVTVLTLWLLAVLLRRSKLLERWLSPRARALRQLRRLSQRLKNTTVEPSEVLLEMVEVVRVYLARHYALVTREATSREIAAQMTMNNRCQTIKPIAKTVLEHGDNAKFAQRGLSGEQAQDLLEQLRTAIAADKGKTT